MILLLHFLFSGVYINVDIAQAKQKGKSVMRMSRHQKIHPISSGDQAFFENFYTEYKKYLFFLAQKYTDSKEGQEDLVQDTIVRLLRNLSALKELNHSQTCKYVALTVRAAFLDGEKRRKGAESACLDDSLLETLLSAECLDRRELPGLAARLEVEQLKRELSCRDWMILEGKYILGYSQEELGQMFGVAPDSVRMMISRAKQKARTILYPEAGRETT